MIDLLNKTVIERKLCNVDASKDAFVAAKGRAAAWWAAIQMASTGKRENGFSSLYKIRLFVRQLTGPGLSAWFAASAEAVVQPKAWKAMQNGQNPGLGDAGLQVDEQSPGAEP